MVQPSTTTDTANGAPLPVIFSGLVPGSDPQGVVEDPRYDETALCRAMGTVAAVCVVASAQ